MAVRELTQEEQRRVQSSGKVRELTPDESKRVTTENQGGFIDSAVDLVTGRDRGRGDLPEFGNVDLSDDVPVGNRAAIGAGFFTTPSEEARRGVIEKNIPGVQFSRDENGNTVVDGLPDGRKAFLNAPGLSMQDASDLLSDAVKFLPAARFAQGGRGVLKLLRGASAAAATSFGEDAAAIPQGSEAGFEPGRAGVTAGAGALGEAAVPLVRAGARGVNSLLRQSRRVGTVVDDSGLTPEGRQALQALDIDPDSVSLDMAESIVRASEQGTDPAKLASAARSQRFDVPLTRGQATRNFRNLADEEVLRGRTDEAGQTIRQFDRDQTERLNAARDDLESQFGGGRSPLQDDAAGGGALRENIRREANTLDAEIDAAFSAARSKEATIGREGLDLVGRSGEGLRRDGFLLDSTNTPATVRALDEIEEVTGSDVVSQNVDELERVRRVVNRQIDAAANPTDRAALTKIKRRFDAALDETFDRALFNGDEDALEALKNARGLRAEFGERFQQRAGRTKSGAKISDPGGSAIEQIVEGNPTDEEVVNMLFGRARLFDSKNASSAIDAVRRATGNSEQADQTLKQLAFRRLTKQATTNGNFSAQKFVSAFDKAMGDTPTVMRKVFSEDDLKNLRELRDTTEQLVQPSRTTNPSGTAAALERFQRAFGNVGAAAGLQAGSIGFGAIGNRLARPIGRVFDRDKALSIAETALDPGFRGPEIDETTTLASLIAAARQGDAPQAAAGGAAAALSGDAEAAPPPPPSNSSNRSNNQSQPQGPIPGLLNTPQPPQPGGLLQ